MGAAPTALAVKPAAELVSLWTLTAVDTDDVSVITGRTLVQALC